VFFVFVFFAIFAAFVLTSVAPILAPAPLISSPLDSLEANAVVVGVAIRRRPDAHQIPLPQRAFCDAVPFEA
jgi:hypothetical protein